MVHIYLCVAYYATALFYFFSGIFLLYKPESIRYHIPKWFPFLASLKLQRKHEIFNLILLGIALAVVGWWFAQYSAAAFLGALILSAWEVYLSFYFYYKKRNEKFSAFYHFVIHSFVVFIVVYVLTTHIFYH